MRPAGVAGLLSSVSFQPDDQKSVVQTEVRAFEVSPIAIARTGPGSLWHGRGLLFQEDGQKQKIGASASPFSSACQICTNKISQHFCLQIAATDGEAIFKFIFKP
jgi:hypothetical protein